MNTEFMFALLSYAPGPFWLMILFFPGNRRAMLAVDVFLITLSFAFVATLIPVMEQILPLVLAPSLDTMQSFLTSKQGFVGTWNHMIISDVWIGRWVALDSLAFRRSLVVRLIFILPIVLVGPFGLFFYLVFRIAVKRQLSLTQPLT